MEESNKRKDIRDLIMEELEKQDEEEKEYTDKLKYIKYLMFGISIGLVGGILLCKFKKTK